MRGHCTAEQKAACPLMKSRCFSDTHHLAYEAKDYSTKVEKEWRELPFNKVQLCRAVHDAIHASGYKPEKPERAVMLAELADMTSFRALQERTTQLAIGQAVMQGAAGYREVFGGQTALEG